MTLLTISEDLDDLADRILAADVMADRLVIQSSPEIARRIEAVLGKVGIGTVAGLRALSAELAREQAAEIAAFDAECRAMDAVPQFTGGWS